MYTEMIEEDWFDKYKPIKNHIDMNAAFDGYLFEPFGDEEDFVKNSNPECVWTYGDGDDGGTYIWNGWQIVNRIGYFITEVPCSIHEEIQVPIMEPEWEDL